MILVHEKVRPAMQLQLERKTPIILHGPVGTQRKVFFDSSA